MRHSHCVGRGDEFAAIPEAERRRGGADESDQRDDKNRGGYKSVGGKFDGCSQVLAQLQYIFQINCCGR